MSMLADLKGGCRLHVLIALALIGKPATQQQVCEKADWSDEAVGHSLAWLSAPERCLVLRIPNGRHPVWELSLTARQLLLPIRSTLEGDLSTGQSLIGDKSDDYVAMTPLRADSDGIVVFLNKGDEDDSHSQTKTLTPLRADSTTHKARLNAAPLIDAAKARLVDRLCDLKVDRARAELAVHNSPFTPPQITEQIVAWVAYLESGQISRRDLFPNLVAKRIAKGDLCPYDPPDALSRFDGYTHLQETEP